MNKVRLHGLFYLLAGVAIVAASYWLLPEWLPWWVYYCALPGPALILVGGLMIARPGDNIDGEFDFGEWLESRPLRERVVYHVVGGIGIALGFLYLLWLAGVLCARAAERCRPPLV